MFITPGLTVLLNIYEQKEHIEVMVREGMDRKYATFEKRFDDQGADMFDFTLYCEDMGRQKNRYIWNLFDREEEEKIKEDIEGLIRDIQKQRNKKIKKGSQKKKGGKKKKDNKCNDENKKSVQNTSSKVAPLTMKVR